MSNTIFFAKFGDLFVQVFEANGKKFTPAFRSHEPTAKFIDSDMVPAFEKIELYRQVGNRSNERECIGELKCSYSKDKNDNEVLKYTAAIYKNFKRHYSWIASAISSQEGEGEVLLCCGSAWYGTAAAQLAAALKHKIGKTTIEVRRVGIEVDTDDPDLFKIGQLPISHKQPDEDRLWRNLQSLLRPASREYHAIIEYNGKKTTLPLEGLHVIAGCIKVKEHVLKNVAKFAGLSEGSIRIVAKNNLTLICIDFATSSVKVSPTFDYQKEVQARINMLYEPMLRRGLPDAHNPIQQAAVDLELQLLLLKAAKLAACEVTNTGLTYVEAQGEAHINVTDNKIRFYERESNKLRPGQVIDLTVESLTEFLAWPARHIIKHI